MSKTTIRNILHRYLSKPENYLVVSPSVNNLLFNGISTYMEARFFTTIADSVNKNIHKLSDSNLYPYRGIIADTINNQIMEYANHASLPIWLIAYEQITEKHIEFLNLNSNIRIIANELLNSKKFQHERLISIPIFQDMNRIETQSKTKNVIILSYNMSEEITNSIKSSLKQSFISCDCMSEQPLSLEFLYKTLSQYKFCIDISSKSIIEPLVAFKTNTYYMHSSVGMDFGQDLSHSTVQSSQDAVKYINNNFWKYRDFDKINEKINRYISANYFTEFKKALSI